MNTRLTLINAAVQNLAAAVTGAKTTILVSSCRDCCEPVLGSYKVSHFVREPYLAQPGMFKSRWATEIVEAYSARDAAEKLGLRAGYNCFVSRQIRTKA